MNAANIIVTTAEELRALIREEVEAAVQARQGHAASEILDIAEVADLLGVTAPTVRAYVRTDGLPCIRMGKSTVRFRRADVERWLLDRSETSGSHASRGRAKLARIRGLGSKK